MQKYFPYEKKRIADDMVEKIRDGDASLSLRKEYPYVIEFVQKIAKVSRISRTSLLITRQLLLR